MDEVERCEGALKQVRDPMSEPFANSRATLKVGTGVKEQINSSSSEEKGLVKGNIHKKFRK